MEPLGNTLNELPATREGFARSWSSTGNPLLEPLERISGDYVEIVLLTGRSVEQ
jgi:hypothetical protein